MGHAQNQNCCLCTVVLEAFIFSIWIFERGGGGGDMWRGGSLEERLSVVRAALCRWKGGRGKGIFNTKE